MKPSKSPQKLAGRVPALDAVLLTDSADDTLELAYAGLTWLEAVLHAIAQLEENGGGTIHIRRLAELGQYVVDDVVQLARAYQNERQEGASC